MYVITRNEKNKTVSYYGFAKSLVKARTLRDGLNYDWYTFF